ncbi:MAG: glycoside hydrolase family 3 C-terminal domain-containing protein, partial [Bacteroidota bacterium]
LVEHEVVFFHVLESVLVRMEKTTTLASAAQDIAPYAEYGMVVDNVEDADVVIYRVNTPFDPRNDEFLEAFFQQGRLWFTEEELGEILPVLKAKPSVVIANLNRPAILTEIDANTQALLVEFGSSDAAVAAVVFGKAKAEGKLPFELPRSKEAVVAQKEDVPYDSENPLYSFGAGN